MCTREVRARVVTMHRSTRHEMLRGRRGRPHKPVGWVTNSDEFVVEMPVRRLVTKRKKTSGSRAKPKPKPKPAPEPEAPADAEMPQFDPSSAPKTIGHWTREEDVLLSKAVATVGPRHWKQVAKLVPGRIGKQCRERWHNQLRPDIKKCYAWTRQEDMLLHRCISRQGRQWSSIAKLLPGRSDNQVKNRYNVLLNNARVYGVGKIVARAFPNDPELAQLAQGNLTRDAPRRPPGWEEGVNGSKRPRNLKQAAVRILNKMAGTRRQGGKQRVWTRDEHARLMVAVPACTVNKDDVLAFSQLGAHSRMCSVNWNRVAAIVGTRSVAGCKEYYRARQRAPREYAAPPPAANEPEERARAEEEEAEVESLGLMDPQDLVAQFTEDPDLKLMAIETLDERPLSRAQWTNSCAMVIGRRGDLGLSFSFPPLGCSRPVPPPVQATVLVPSTATGRAWQWVMEKERRAAEEWEEMWGSETPSKKKKKMKVKAARSSPPPLAEAAAAGPPPPPALPTAVTPEMTDYFQERKRRQEAEELAKSVFA